MKSIDSIDVELSVLEMYAATQVREVSLVALRSYAKCLTLLQSPAAPAEVIELP